MRHNAPPARVHTLKPYNVCVPNGNPLRWVCWHLVTHKRFQPVILCLIAINTGIIAAGTALNESVSSTLNNMFAVIFLVEGLAKVIALKPSGYFRDFSLLGHSCTEAVFDTAIAAGGLMELVLPLLLANV